LNLPLANSESLQIEGGIEPTGQPPTAQTPTSQPIDLMAFAQAIHGSFAARRRVWERPALS
jgi:hypothetical protein